MTNTISFNSPSVCDPNLASCEDAPPVPATPPAAEPAVINLEPVLITGDAGSQELLRRYDASRACGAEKQTALLTCPTIATSMLNGLEGGPWTGVAGAFHGSVLCGKELRALFDCHEQAEAQQSSARQVVEDCHDRGGTIRAGASAQELICEVEP